MAKSLTVPNSGSFQIEANWQDERPHKERAYKRSSSGNMVDAKRRNRERALHKRTEQYWQWLCFGKGAGQPCPGCDDV